MISLLKQIELGRGTRTIHSKSFFLLLVAVTIAVVVIVGY